jgi:hypothetical protein
VIEIMTPDSPSRWIARFVAAASLLAFAPETLATPLTAGDKIKLYDSYGNTGGGEFNAKIGPGYSQIDFVTFCIEYNEHFYPGQEMLVQAVTTQAVMGGNGNGTPSNAPLVYGTPAGSIAAGTPDVLDPRTAYLFTKFTAQTLSGYDFGNTGSARVMDANSLQRAIWYIENEATYGSSIFPLNDYQAVLWFNEANDAVNSGEWTGVGNVRVLNLLRPDTSGNFTIQAQDQLYMVPVPEPGTLGCVAAGLLALARRAGSRRR